MSPDAPQTTAPSYICRHYKGPQIVRRCSPDDDRRMEAMRIKGASLSDIARA